jgi:hypothetical protein
MKITIDSNRVKVIEHFAGVYESKTGQLYAFTAIMDSQEGNRIFWPLKVPELKQFVEEEIFTELKKLL